MKKRSQSWRRIARNVIIFSIILENIKYPPLKLIIMPASLDARGFSKYFGGAKAVHVQGRQYPVDILYTPHPEPDYIDATLITIFQIYLEEGPGDILVFLTGLEEIESVERLIQEQVQQIPERNQKLLVVPTFSSLPSEQQMQVFKPAPPGHRKVLMLLYVYVLLHVEMIRFSFEDSLWLPFS